MCPHWFTPHGELMEPAALTAAEAAVAQQLAGTGAAGPDPGVPMDCGVGPNGVPSLSSPQAAPSEPPRTGATGVAVDARSVGSGAGGSDTTPGAGTLVAVTAASGVGNQATGSSSALAPPLVAAGRPSLTGPSGTVPASHVPSGRAPPASGASAQGVPVAGGTKHPSSSSRNHITVTVDGAGHGVRSRCLPTTRGRGRDAGGQQPSGHKRMVPVKIEPKTFFANERTFIQWLGAAVLLVTLSVAMTSLGSTETRRNARPAAIVFSVVSLVFLAYALYLFLWRDSMIRQKSAGPYNDRKGPVVLVLVLAAAMIATLVFMSTGLAGFVAVDWHGYSPGITLRAGECDLVGSVASASAAGASSGVNLAAPFSPTSIVLHTGVGTVGSWVVAAPYKLALMPAAPDGTVAPLSNASYLATPNLNAQSITVVPPASTMVYLGTDAGEVVRFDLATSTVQRRWDLANGLRGSEALLWGMAFVPSSSDPEGGTFWVTDANWLYEVGMGCHRQLRS